MCNPSPFWCTIACAVNMLTSLPCVGSCTDYIRSPLALWSHPHLWGSLLLISLDQCNPLNFYTREGLCHPVVFCLQFYDSCASSVFLSPPHPYWTSNPCHWYCCCAYNWSYVQRRQQCPPLIRLLLPLLPPVCHYHSFSCWSCQGSHIPALLHPLIFTLERFHIWSTGHKIPHYLPHFLNMLPVIL